MSLPQGSRGKDEGKRGRRKLRISITPNSRAMDEMREYKEGRVSVLSRIERRMRGRGRGERER